MVICLISEDIILVNLLVIVALSSATLLFLSHAIGPRGLTPVMSGATGLLGGVAAILETHSFQRWGVVLLVLLALTLVARPRGFLSILSAVTAFGFGAVFVIAVNRIVLLEINADLQSTIIVFLFVIVVGVLGCGLFRNRYGVLLSVTGVLLMPQITDQRLLFLMVYAILATGALFRLGGSSFSADKR